MSSILTKEGCFGFRGRKFPNLMTENIRSTQRKKIVNSRIHADSYHHQNRRVKIHIWPGSEKEKVAWITLC